MKIGLHIIKEVVKISDVFFKDRVYNWPSIIHVGPKATDTENGIYHKTL